MGEHLPAQLRAARGGDGRLDEIKTRGRCSSTCMLKSCALPQCELPSDALPGAEGSEGSGKASGEDERAARPDRCQLGTLHDDAVLQPDRSRRAADVHGPSPDSRRIVPRRGGRSHPQERDTMNAVAGIDVAKDQLDLHLWPLQPAG